MEKEKLDRIIRIIDWVLISTLIAVVIWAKYQGMFVEKEIIELCYGISKENYGINLQNLTNITWR